MTDEIKATVKANDASRIRDESRIRQASEAIRGMANDLQPAAKGLEPVMRRITDDLCNITREAPLQSLAIAFLLGVMIARRR
jgi:chorismate mutase